MLNGSKKWIEINPFGKNIVQGDNDGDGIPDAPEDNDIIYDGGTV